MTEMTLAQAKSALRKAEKANDLAYAKYAKADAAFRKALDAKHSAEDAAFAAQSVKMEAESVVEALTNAREVSR